MKRSLVLMATLVLGAFIYSSIARTLLQPIATLPRLPGGIATLMLLLMVFSICHAWYALGWRHMLLLLGLSSVISLLYEEVGVATGLIYGPYHYTDVLGAKLGLVPILIPIAWFAMIYPSYVIANLIADGQPIGSRGSLGRMAWVALLSALVMTAWDLLLDPILSQPNVQAWIWERPGSYFGVPIRNYIGWLLTAFTIYLIYRLIERRFAPRPIGEATTGFTLLALIAYGAMMFSNMLAGPSDLMVIGPFTMGLAIAFALDRLFRRSSLSSADRS